MFELKIYNNSSKQKHSTNDFFHYKEINGIYEQYKEYNKYYALKCIGNFNTWNVKYTYV